MDWLEVLGFERALTKWPHLSVETLERQPNCPELVVVRPQNARVEKLPVVYWIHGGGFVLGGPKSKAVVSQAHYLNAVVISVNYRLAPEHPFPAAADDCIDGMKWVWENIEFFGNPEKFIVSGMSAGGQLTCVCAQTARDLGIPLKFHIPMAPCVYPFVATESAIENTQLNRPFLPVEKMAWFYQKYFGRNPRIDTRANVFNGTFEGVSPAIICLSKNDILVNDAEDYAKALKKAGVEVKLHYIRGGHMSLILNGELKNFLMEVKSCLTKGSLQSSK